MRFVFLCKTEIKYYKKVSNNPYMEKQTAADAEFLAKAAIFGYSIICIDM